MTNGIRYRALLLLQILYMYNKKGRREWLGWSVLLDMSDYLEEGSIPVLFTRTGSEDYFFVYPIALHVRKLKLFTTVRKLVLIFRAETPELRTMKM